MEKKEDIGAFVKKAFKKESLNTKPDERVWKKIHTSLDKKEQRKKNLLWTLMSLTFFAISAFLLWDNSALLESKPTNNNSTNETGNFKHLKKNDSAHKTTQKTKFISIKKKENTQSKNIPTEAVSTTKDTVVNKQQKKKTTPKINFEDQYEVKTTHHYYRSYDSLKIETQEKAIIDSVINAAAKQENPIDSLSNNKGTAPQLEKQE